MRIKENTFILDYLNSLSGYDLAKPESMEVSKEFSFRMDP